VDAYNFTRDGHGRITLNIIYDGTIGGHVEMVLPLTLLSAVLHSQAVRHAADDPHLELAARDLAHSIDRYVSTLVARDD
jgi:hypothetical protein